jgi:hypothetical protein
MVRWFSGSQTFNHLGNLNSSELIIALYRWSITASSYDIPNSRWVHGRTIGVGLCTQKVYIFHTGNVIWAGCDVNWAISFVLFCNVTLMIYHIRECQTLLCPNLEFRGLPTLWQATSFILRAVFRCLDLDINCHGSKHWCSFIQNLNGERGSDGRLFQTNAAHIKAARLLQLRWLSSSIARAVLICSGRLEELCMRLMRSAMSDYGGREVWLPWIICGL